MQPSLQGGSSDSCDCTTADELIGVGEYRLCFVLASRSRHQPDIHQPTMMAIAIAVGRWIDHPPRWIRFWLRTGHPYCKPNNIFVFK
jgi:hypothetical protein